MNQLQDPCWELLQSQVTLGSGSGIKAEGRTGMTSLVIGVLFLSCLFFAYLLHHAKQIDGLCKALVYVAVLFVRNIVDIGGMIFPRSTPAVLAMIITNFNVQYQSWYSACIYFLRSN